MFDQLLNMQRANYSQTLANALIMLCNLIEPTEKKMPGLCY